DTAHALLREPHGLGFLLAQAHVQGVIGQADVLGGGCAHLLARGLAGGRVLAFAGTQGVVALLVQCFKAGEVAFAGRVASLAQALLLQLTQALRFVMRQIVMRRRIPPAARAMATDRVPELSFATSAPLRPAMSSENASTSAGERVPLAPNHSAESSPTRAPLAPA